MKKIKKVDGIGQKELSSAVEEFIRHSLTRTMTFMKGITESNLIGQDFSLLRQNENFDWLKMERPTEMIEKLLPSGLSDYFFFDGESMIADLRVKSQDSAGKLRKALYSMFDLDVVEAAINHIGNDQARTTVLGRLYLSKSNVKSGSAIAAIKTNIENAQKKIDNLTAQIGEYEQEIQRLQERVTEISEEIGGIRTRQDYEKQRSDLKKQRDLFLQNAQNNQAQFGTAIMEIFPSLLIARAVSSSKNKLQDMASAEVLPRGISEDLIEYLTDPNTTTCVCGRPLCNAEREHVLSYLRLMPPRSYASIYQNFCNRAGCMIIECPANTRLQNYLLEKDIHMKRTFLCILLAALFLLPAGITEQYFQQITQEEAQRILGEETDYILLDVRTEEEYDEGHIPGAINIANEDIGTDEIPELPDKDQMILVYCRSGRRSKEASAKLSALGYSQVLEFGGILTWPGEVISTEEEELILDDPFEAHEYGDPEDFYEDWGDNFDDYEEAEEYYYEHGGW